MEKDILIKLKMESRDEAVKFLKSLWIETPQPCPLCGGRLDSNFVKRHGYADKKRFEL